MSSDEDLSAGAARPGSRFNYPLMLDVSDRLVVVVGGGSVAARKAAGLLEAGATRVRCVAPEFHPEMPTAPACERVLGRYEARFLEGATLVLAATDSPEVNDAVVRHARARGIFVSRADTGEDVPGDFTTPALFREGPVTVTISAGGSPALAALIRDGVRGRWDPRWSQMAQLMTTLRPLVQRANLSTEQRRQAMRELATNEALDLLATRGADGLIAWLRKKYPSVEG